MKIRRTVSGRLTQVAAVGALAAVAGLAGALATGLAASASPVAGKAVAATDADVADAGAAGAGRDDQPGLWRRVVLVVLGLPGDRDQRLPQRGFGEFAETWNGSRWTVRTVPDGTGDDNLDGVQCRSAHGAWRSAARASGQRLVPVADRWNGRAWTQAKPPVPRRATNSDLAAVACSGTTACTAIGESAKGTDAPSLLAERWNGSAWKIQRVPAPAGGGLLNAIACPTAQRLPRGGQRQQGPVLRGLERLVVGDPAGPGAGRRVVRGAERHLLHGG